MVLNRTIRASSNLADPLTPGYEIFLEEGPPSPKNVFSLKSEVPQTLLYVKGWTFKLNELSICE